MDSQFSFEIHLEVEFPAATQVEVQIAGIQSLEDLQLFGQILNPCGIPNMAPSRSLPLAEEWEDPDSYIDALLDFSTSTVLFMNLCGGVHILDFLTRKPDLYTNLLPVEWRDFFEHFDVHQILHLLLHEDIEPLRDSCNSGDDTNKTWNGGPHPPSSLIDYIYNVRRLSLRREFNIPDARKPLPYKTTVGMNKKKLHEVEFFSRSVASLADVVHERRGEPVSHIVDFGSGQNYLGRTLASSPYHKHIIAIERRHHNISGAQGMDVHAMLAEKKKKEKLVYVQNSKSSCKDCNGTPEVAVSKETSDSELEAGAQPSSDGKPSTTTNPDTEVEDTTIFKMLGEINLEPNELRASSSKNKQPRQKPEEPEIDSRGKISYIEHDISDGYLEPIISHVVSPPPDVPVENTDSDETAVTVKTDKQETSDARVMVVSLHSCGNLVHHGIRSLILNPSVVAVAMIGCCYNLMTERLGPATYKLPILRSLHPRLNQTGNSYDPHGFPMSKRFEKYESHGGTGMKLNITARMMAVQAPYNWGYEESEGFFTRHFFRALIQRVLVDRGVMPQPGIPTDLYSEDTEEAINKPPPLILGSLRKSAFSSFAAYVRAATVKLSRDPYYGVKVQERICSMSDDELDNYEREYRHGRKNLSLVWSLMAFSAQVVEALIVSDRWQFLREHESVKECWVEPVFDYSISPRNLAVIGLKK